MLQTFDVLVIGGGIIGASASHHAASAGYRTLLVEQGDYASGTSSRTSRMQNCGFMYFFEAHQSLLKFMLRPRRLLSALELARRTMRDRGDFVRTSPDRVRKVDFYIPFDEQGKVTRLRMWTAAHLLQLMGGPAVSLEPVFIRAKDAPSDPVLSLLREQERKRGGFRFSEYQYNWPERIVIDTILKARAAGLDARNYTKVVALVHQSGFWNATLEHAGQTYTVKAKAIINAAGAWVDHVTQLSDHQAIPINSGAKGVNLLVRLPHRLKGCGLETVTSRGTPFFLMPWGDYHYLGPADAPADAALTEFRATDAEINEILVEANKLFAKVQLSRADVIYSWAGVRPRTLSKHEPLGSMEVREHDLSTAHRPAFLAFTGGLIMTHRDAGRRLLRLLRRHVLPSGKPMLIDYKLKSQPDEDTVNAVSVRRAIVDEQAITLADILRRRLSVGWAADLGLGVAERASRLAAEVLGWSEIQRRQQLEDYRAEVQYNFRPAVGLENKH